MSKFLIERPSYGPHPYTDTTEEIVDAFKMELDHGDLTFLNDDWTVFKAFAQGQWFKVEKITIVEPDPNEP